MPRNKSTKSRVVFDVKPPESSEAFIASKNSNSVLDLQVTSEKRQATRKALQKIQNTKYKIQNTTLPVAGVARVDFVPSHFDRIINDHVSDPRKELLKFGAVTVSAPRPQPGSFKPIPPKNVILAKNPAVKNDGESEDKYSDVIKRIKEPAPHTEKLGDIKESNELDIKIHKEEEGPQGSTFGLRPTSAEAGHAGSFYSLLGNIEAETAESTTQEYYEPITVSVQQNNVLQAPQITQVPQAPLFYRPPRETKPLFRPKESPRKKIWPYLAGAVLAGLLVYYFLGYGLGLKREIMTNGNRALTDLKSAEADLKNFNFTGATSNFQKAYESFATSGDKLNFMGEGLTSIFYSLPGGGKLKSANNLIEAGKSIARSGQAISEAVDNIAKTSDIFDENASSVSVKNIVQSIEDALSVSQKNIARAQVLLNDVGEDILPEDKREEFIDFKKQLPEFKKTVDDALSYSSFLESFIGIYEPKRYLFLFQNSSELRPTGGFPGTYGILSFEDGKLSDFLVDDVYNLDGQLSENIVPPVQMQHITPNWGMRDANWFADFPTSARKAEYFYQKISGKKVDGVMTLSPDIISEILNILGPVEMPEYGLTLNGDNFLSTIQAEVEYGDNRKQPKKIVFDLAPRLMAKINSASPGQWLEIFNIIVGGLEQKDILMYFDDLSLRNFASSKGFDGAIKNPVEDYLMINMTNIKGSKTDAFTNTETELETSLEEGRAIHKLRITRRHNGGQTKYGFYNRQNPAYVRVLVPKGSELISVSGNDEPSYRPLISYSGTDFYHDNDLKEFEKQFVKDRSGADIFVESGKTGFGFWLITDPGDSKTVQLEYSVPINDDDSYSLYVQRQPGVVIKDFDFTIKSGLRAVSYYSPEFNKIGSIFTLTKPLDEDLQIGIIFE